MPEDTALEDTFIGSVDWRAHHFCLYHGYNDIVHFDFYQQHSKHTCMHTSTELFRVGIKDTLRIQNTQICTHTHKGRGNWSTRRNTLMSNPVNKCYFQKKMSTEIQTHNIWFSVVVTSALATALQTAPNIYIYTFHICFHIHTPFTRWMETRYFLYKF